MRKSASNNLKYKHGVIHLFKLSIGLPPTLFLTYANKLLEGVAYKIDNNNNNNNNNLVW